MRDIASYVDGNTPCVSANNMDGVVKSFEEASTKLEEASTKLEEASTKLFKWLKSNEKYCWQID